MNKEEMPTYGELYAENFRLKHNEKVLLDRIDKAIKYIEEYQYFIVDNDSKEELLEILRGKDENN